MRTGFGDTIDIRDYLTAVTRLDAFAPITGDEFRALYWLKDELKVFKLLSLRHPEHLKGGEE